jgi:hypothetical protein
MANLFESVLGNLNDVQQDLLGPDYAYWKQVKSPSEIGMSGDGNLGALSRDVAGLIDYVQILVAGGGGASKVNGPMGNKFFLKTGAKCKDTQSGKKVDRFIYVNNVPDGQIPFISQGMGGMTFSNFEGLVPGALGDMNALNPFAMLQAFMMGNVPDCEPLTMETIDANNSKSQQTQYVATTDIRNMNPCWFQNETNPVTGSTCRRAFQSMMKEVSPNEQIPSGVVPILFLTGVSGLSLYLLYKMCKKMK